MTTFYTADTVREPPTPGMMADYELRPAVDGTGASLFVTWSDNVGKPTGKDLPMWHKAPRCYPAWTGEGGWPVIDPTELLHFDLLADLWLAETVREERGLPRTVQFCSKCICRRVA